MWVRWAGSDRLAAQGLAHGDFRENAKGVGGSPRIGSREAGKGAELSGLEGFDDGDELIHIAQRAVALGLSLSFVGRQARTMLQGKALFRIQPCPCLIRLEPV